MKTIAKCLFACCLNEIGHKALSFVHEQSLKRFLNEIFFYKASVKQFSIFSRFEIHLYIIQCINYVCIQNDYFNTEVE